MVFQYPVYVRLALIWLGLAVVPSWLLLTSQQVFPWLDLSGWLANLLYALTSTGTAPYAILTVVVFWAISFQVYEQTSLAKNGTCQFVWLND